MAGTTEAAAVSTDEPVPGSRLGAVALHPVLLAAYPSLALWAANVDEVTAGDAWPAIWVPTAIAIGGWAVAAAVVRSTRRGAFIASVLVTVGLWTGRLVGGMSVAALAGVAVAAAVAVGFGVRRLSRDTTLGLTAVANVLSLVLVALTVPTIVSASVARVGDQGPAGAVAIPADVDPADLPDIYYIIPDRYPRGDTLAEMFGFDNTPWISALEARGFQVADGALGNYPSTGMSLASTWNLELIDDLVESPPENRKDWAPVYALMRDHVLGRTLVDAGYEYIHMGTWWSPTAVAKSATQNLRLDGTSEFVSVFKGQIGQEIGLSEDDGQVLEDLIWHERSPLHTLFQWQELRRLADEAHEPRAQPRFVLAHITVPHEPYVFEADGSPVPRLVAKERTREDNFLRQVQFVNNEIDDFLDRLLVGPPEAWPIVVIQSDEGPTPAAKTSAGYSYLDAPTEERREKLQIFSAILMPASSDLVLPEDLVSVNTWRYIFDDLLGTDLGPISAPIYVYAPDDLYEFVEVTDELRTSAAG